MGKRKSRRRAPARLSTTPHASQSATHARVADFEVEIERILPGGMGLAHAAGQTVLVALAAPGDRLKVRVESVRGKLVFASIVEVLAPAPARVEPPCPYFGRCGGCDFQQLTYEAQLEAKVGIIHDCLRRLARLEPPAPIHITPSPDPWHYRSRAQWQHDARAQRLGYFERGSHRVCDVVHCPVIVPELQQTLDELRRELPLLHQSVEVQAAESQPAEFRPAEFQAVAGDAGAVTLTPPLRAAAPREATRTIGGEHYRYSADCFFQINHALLEPLVREAIKDARGQLALDLYCGVGLFTLPLARRFKRLIGVEGNPHACTYARRNLDDAALTNARIETASVGDWLKEHAPALPPVDFLLLDPPRTGAEPEAIEAINRLQPQRIAYVSCDPATLARDLRLLTAHGYRLDTLQAFDMFPQTHHVETVAHLTCAGLGGAT